MTDKNEIFCSIIIPSYNSKLTICKTLDSLNKMQTEYSYEIIVVDSSSDETPVIIENNYPRVKLIHLQEQTYPGSARNLGLRHALGTYVVFLDSDCMVIEEWLNLIVDTHEENKEYAAVVGSIGNGTPNNLVGCASYLIEFNEWTPKTKKREINYILGGNVSYKKRIIMKHNLSYTDIFPSEDTIFAQDLIAKGEKILFIPEITVYHINNTSLNKVLQHQYVLGNASARARRDKGMAGNIISRYKILILGVPFIRFFRAFIRLMKQDVVLLLKFILVSPIYFLAACFWSIGYMGKDNFKPTKIEVQK